MGGPSSLSDQRIEQGYQLMFVTAIMLSLFFSAIGPIAIAAIALGVPVVLQMVFGRTRYDKLVALVLANLVFWMSYAILNGAIGLEELGNPAFYAYEGRSFLTYVPFLVTMALVVTRQTLGVLDGLMRAGAIMALLAVAMNLVGVLPEAMKHRDGLVLFMSSHHASGYFFALLSVYFLARVATMGRAATRWDVIFLGASLLGVLSTNSRTALLGIAVALVIYYAGRIFVPRVMMAALAIGIATVTIGPPLVQATNPKLANKLSAITDPRTLVAVNTAVQFVLADDDPIPYSDELENRQSNNITVRIYLWTIAVKKFAESPLLGVGFMRWNDLRFRERYTEIPGLVRILTQSSQRSIGVGNAHNTFLMMLAETGIIGFTLIMAFWLSLARRMRRVATQAAARADLQIEAMANAGRLMVFFVFGAGLTAFSFAAPSIGFMPLLLCGTVIAAARSVTLQAGTYTPGSNPDANPISARAVSSQV